MSGHNLSHDGELRYIIQWFAEWSGFQRDDFLPILADYLGKDNSGTYVNGMVSSLAGASCIDKPMSLFQCRVSSSHYLVGSVYKFVYTKLSLRIFSWNITIKIRRRFLDILIKI